jgi:hypothetical protein
MKRMGRLLGVFMIAGVLLGQTGCAMLAGQAAVAVGKHVYEKVKDDKAKNEQVRQE